MKRVGLFFGSFNPIHIGHLVIANHFAEYAPVDQVWFVVTPHNPHKKKSTLLDDHHRLAMVRMAIEEYPKLRASDIEFKLPQPNYTVNTLAHLEEKHPNYQFSLVLGTDNLFSFHKWKNYEVILQNYSLLVYPRLTTTRAENPFLEHPHVQRIEAPIMEISSTFIRQGIAENKNVRPYLPPVVWTYIDEMNFYRLR